ncbi:MAG: LD-carboxypeptidase [Bacteroidia bacterium]|nr:LD-carboxypeptidase [Bacteroidia bacterium]
MLPSTPPRTIGILAPARKVSPAEMAPGIALLESWGLKVKLSKHLYGEHHQFSGTDAERAADFQEMMNDAEVDAIISARGGYGCMRIVDRLDFTVLKKHPKWIIGFSDMTVFHSHLYRQLNLATLHAPMVYSMGENRTSAGALEQLRRMLQGEEVLYSVENAVYNRKGKAEAVLVGGNLSLLYALSGSASDPDTNGKILFIEDLDEYLYHIDRMMLQLKRSGKLSGLKGLIVGGMSDMKDNTVPFGKTAEAIIAEAVAEYDFPVCMNFPAGHIHDNNPLRLGAKVTLEVGESVSLQF